MSDLKKMFEDLRAEFPPGCVKTKKLKGTTISYLTARAVMDRLDKVCGPENWRDEYEIHGKAVACTLYLYIPAHMDDENSEYLHGYGWIGKTDTGVESNWEPEKGAFSDALKRAAVRWGIGRYLYGDGEQDTQKPTQPERRSVSQARADSRKSVASKADPSQQSQSQCGECRAPHPKHATGCSKRKS